MRSQCASQISESLLHFETTGSKYCKIMGMVVENVWVGDQGRSFIFKILSPFRNHYASKATGVENKGRISHFLTHEKFNCRRWWSYDMCRYVADLRSHLRQSEVRQVSWITNGAVSIAYDRRT